MAWRAEGREYSAEGREYSARRAQQMSAEMGYHWGGVDAAEVLEALG